MKTLGRVTHTLWIEFDFDPLAVLTLGRRQCTDRLITVPADQPVARPNNINAEALYKSSIYCNQMCFQSRSTFLRCLYPGCGDQRRIRAIKVEHSLCCGWYFPACLVPSSCIICFKRSRDPMLLRLLSGSTPVSGKGYSIIQGGKSIIVLTCK